MLRRREAVHDLQGRLHGVRRGGGDHDDLVTPLPVAEGLVAGRDAADPGVQELVELAHAREVALALLAEPRVAVDVEERHVEVGDRDVALEVARAAGSPVRDHELAPQSLGNRSG